MRGGEALSRRATIRDPPRDVVEGAERRRATFRRGASIHIGHACARRASATKTPGGRRSTPRRISAAVEPRIGIAMRCGPAVSEIVRRRRSATGRETCGPNPARRGGGGKGRAVFFLVSLLDAERSTSPGRRPRIARLAGCFATAKRGSGRRAKRFRQAELRPAFGRYTGRCPAGGAGGHGPDASPIGARPSALRDERNAAAAPASCRISARTDGIPEPNRKRSCRVPPKRGFREFSRWTANDVRRARSARDTKGGSVRDPPTRPRPGPAAVGRANERATGLRRREGARDRETRTRRPLGHAGRPPAGCFLSFGEEGRAAERRGGRNRRVSFQTFERKSLERAAK